MYTVFSTCKDKTNNAFPIRLVKLSVNFWKSETNFTQWILETRTCLLFMKLIGSVFRSGEEKHFPFQDTWKTMKLFWRNSVGPTGELCRKSIFFARKVLLANKHFIGRVFTGWVIHINQPYLNRTGFMAFDKATKLTFGWEGDSLHKWWL